MTPSRFFRRGLPLLCAWLLVSSNSVGQVVQPPPPKDYDVQVRFRIRQPMPQYLDRLDEMLASFKTLGFVRDERPEDEQEDPDVDRVTGRIPSANPRKILLNPFAQTILLSPHGYKLPVEAGSRVKVNLEIATGLAKDRQRVLFDQILNQLDQIGFREMVGYDHRGFTRIFGTIGGAELPRLLRDLRTEPNGWLVPRTPPAALPTPLRNVNPIQVVEVMPEPGDVAPAQEPAGLPVYPPDQAYLSKITADLRAALAGQKDEQVKLRVEVILRDQPADSDRSWDRDLRAAAPGSVVEGRFGTAATVLAPVGKVPELARPSFVLAVRLPRAGEAAFRPLAEAPVDFLKEMHLNTVHQLGYQGAGIKIAVIGGDFGGYKKLLGNRLPAGTKLVDFTTARNSEILPDPMPSDDGMFGHGALCALAVHVAAPKAELVLVRIDPAAPHQLLTIARLLNEDAQPLDSLEDRVREVTRDTEFLQSRRRDLLEERRKAIEGLSFEEGDTALPELKKRYEESQARLKRVLADLDELTKSEARLRERTDRLLSIRAELSALQRVRVVVCPLVWNSGYPLDGASALSRYFDERPFVGMSGDGASKTRIAALRGNRHTLWVQAAGDTRGQTWAGLFRDEDNNNALEFAPMSDALGKGRWTAETNFLAWQPHAGASAPELPEKARVRVSIQWREPHDPALASDYDDPYREPIANLNLYVLKQRDPTGTKLATDDLEVISRTAGAAVRLARTPASGIYEQTAEFDVPAGGRFALRVEGRVPDNVRPASSPAVQGQRQVFELRPRIFVEVLDPATRSKGRVVFLDYAGAPSWPFAPTFNGSYGGVGMPADARNVLTIGGADAAGRPSSLSAVGAGPTREMMLKPDLLGFESVDLGDRLKASGSGVAASLNAGAAACLLGMNVSAQPRHFMQLLNLPPGSVLRIPNAWFEPK